jgi:hypothetical protein
MKKSTITLFIALVFGIIGMFGLVTTAFAAALDGCSKECSSCQASCEKARDYVKSKGGVLASGTEKQLSDCIDLCKASHGLLQRESKLHPQLCKVCAQACNDCAKACEAAHDPKLKECIDECKKCAVTCTEMSS